VFSGLLLEGIAHLYAFTFTCVWMNREDNCNSILHITTLRFISQAITAMISTPKISVTPHIMSLIIICFSCSHPSPRRHCCTWSFRDSGSSQEWLYLPVRTQSPLFNPWPRSSVFTQLIGWDGVSLIFCPGWPWTVILPISISRAAGIDTCEPLR
jgi:hypothetical protein